MKHEEDDEAERIGQFDLSPDRHVLALARETGEMGHETVHVWSWRDGKLLGEVHFPWIDSPFIGKVIPQVTSDGRVWLTSITCDGNLNEKATVAFYCWSIAGHQIARGYYASTIPVRGLCEGAEISPDGTRVLVSAPEESAVAYPIARDVDYAGIRVDKDKVRFTHICNANISGVYRWNSSNTVLDEKGVLVGPKSVQKPVYHGL